MLLSSIIYATPLYTAHRDDCSPLPFQVIQVSVVNYSRDRVMYTETNCPLTSTLLARCQNLAQPHVLLTDTARLTVLCVRSRDPPRDTSVIGTRTNRRRESVDITSERLRAYHIANACIWLALATLILAPIHSWNRKGIGTLVSCLVSCLTMMIRRLVKVVQKHCCQQPLGPKHRVKPFRRGVYYIH